MNDLSDQLRALGLDLGQEESRVPLRDKLRSDKPRNRPRDPKGRGNGRPPAVDPVQMLLRLPCIGKVKQLEEERGFGFITASAKEDVFFHVSGFDGRLPDGQKLPPVGTDVLYIIGSDPKRPDDSRQSVIAWMPAAMAAGVTGMPIADQPSLDGIRRDQLMALSWDQLWSLVRADWYAKRWSSVTDAPADLEDAVLQQVVLSRLAELSAEELAAKPISSWLSVSSFRSISLLSPGMPGCNFKLLLAKFQSQQLACLQAPSTQWLDDPRLTQEQCQQLLEWHLLSRALFEPHGYWTQFFPGTTEKEAVLASRYLEIGIEPDTFVEGWLQRLAENKKLTDEQLEQCSRHSSWVPFFQFDQLSQGRQDELLQTWRQEPQPLATALARDPTLGKTMLLSTALSLDLETDGERIWEIGCARDGQAQLLHDERKGTDREQALAELAGKLQVAPLVVGHNLIAWDWPILSRQPGMPGSALLWDTLLMEYLLAPQSASHALGSNHHADKDAKAAAKLFEKQLKSLPEDIAARVLLGRYADFSQLLADALPALEGKIKLTRKPPAFLDEAGNPPTRLLLADAEFLRQTDWVSGTSVVAADSSLSLSLDWLEVDADLLAAQLHDELAHVPEAQLLLAVARATTAQGIALRRNMVPVWLLERQPAVRSAVDAACKQPQAREGARLASLPTQTSWWQAADPEQYVVIGRSQDVLLLDHQTASVSAFSQSHPDLPNASFIQLGHDGATLQWLLADRAGEVLDPQGGLETFATLPVAEDSLCSPAGSQAPLTRPKFLKRQFHVLHPRAEDQGSYWAEVLRTVHAVGGQGAQAVRVLLVGSSGSKILLDMLATALAELGLGESRPEHRSQREHLRRAADRGWVVVDTLANWSQWQAHGQSLGIELQPVVEALPLEQWHACEQTRLALQTADKTGDAELDVSEGTAAPQALLKVISKAELLEAVPVLVKAHLFAWMAQTGLAAADQAMICIDPRVSGVVSQLSGLVETVRLPEMPLPDDKVQALEVVLAPFKLEREVAPSSLEAMQEFLVRHWQPKDATTGNAVTGFKPSQTQAMEVICQRNANVLVPLPTGEGKSVLFQVPALCRGLRNRRLTLVLSPLKALMRDQVERLREQGFAESADFINSDLTRGELEEIIQGILDHRIVLLYVAPERLRSEVFLDVLHKRMKADNGLEHVVFDETHCVNQWGYQFRPDYFHALQVLLEKCQHMDKGERTQFLLLSATVTTTDKERLEALLGGERRGASSPLPLVVRPQMEKFSNPLRSHIQVVPQPVVGDINNLREFEQALVERLPYIQQAISQAQANRVDTGQRSAVIVFVFSRRQAEMLAQRLAQICQCQVDYYHAGLDAGTREEIYARFLDGGRDQEGGLDVLVATKAFGMGMDIPDIHWVIHLGPPGYLEDYLQEVGRIGRGQKERDRAGLEKLTARLLFSEEDFGSIRTMRASSAISRGDVKNFLNELKKRSQRVKGQQMVVVPEQGYGPPAMTDGARRAAATRVRMQLYWLERAKLSKLCGTSPDLMSMMVNVSVLTRIAAESGDLAELAGRILSIKPDEDIYLPADQVQHQSANRVSDSGLLDGAIEAVSSIFSALMESVGTFFGTQKRQEKQDPFDSWLNGADEDKSVCDRCIVLNLSYLRLHDSELRPLSTVLAMLVDLERRGGLSLSRVLDVVPRWLSKETPELIEKQIAYIDGAVEELLRRLSESGRLEFNPFEMVQDLEGPKVDQKSLRAYERSFINGFRYLARASGIKTRQLIKTDGRLLWEAEMPKKLRWKVNERRECYVRGIRALRRVIGDKHQISLADAVDQVRALYEDRRFRDSDLKKLAGLMSATGLASMVSDLVPPSHIVAISPGPASMEDHEEVWEELKQVNDLAEARNLAMEVFANLKVEAQTAFITGYFKTRNAEEVKAFLGTQLEELILDGDDAAGGSMLLSSMRDKVRATKATEFFDRFRTSEEPAQWAVSSVPADQNILVNAGPGAGKTFVLVGRIAHLIREHRVDPSQIVVLAFNRAVVFEIRRRIRDLFKSLGYASYVGRLRVFTFHSFALRSLARESVDLTGVEMSNVVDVFAKRLASDPAFAVRVAAGARCILVDEFQDMNDGVYSIIRSLYEGTDRKAGVMVIGDDDQDILRWNRKENGAPNFSEKYFDDFERDFGGENFSKHLLAVNFRSGSLIVERSQDMITGFFKRTDRSRRLKEGRLRARCAAIEGTCRGIDWKGGSWSNAVESSIPLLREMLSVPGQTTAVLCRSNAEVADAHRRLSQHFPHLAIQGAANLNIADLRHVAVWLDCLRDAAEQFDEKLTDELRERVRQTMLQRASIPEWSAPASVDVDLDHLWALCCREQSFPYLSSLIRFVEELKTDELVRLSGLEEGATTAVVSTLHKVKGLEYDNVLILPSSIPFGKAPSRWKEADLAGDACEEARLLYVGMTRAKRRLDYFRGDRELSWGRSVPVPFEGSSTDGRVLTGSMEDVSLGWSMINNAYQTDQDALQRYIETEVVVGDRIILGGRGGGFNKTFMHQGRSGQRRQVGFLARKHDVGAPDADLKVSAVVRFRPELTDQGLAPGVRARGWGYAVLVSGRLR